MAKKYHFEIPDKNISKKEINKNAFGESVPRDNYSEHGLSLKSSKELFKEHEFRKKDLQVLSDIFLQISTLDDLKIKNHSSKFENLGFKLISTIPDNQSIGNFKINNEKFQEFETKLDEYIYTEENKYKTYFAPIENIKPIPDETKVVSINLESTEKYNIIINFFSGLKSNEIFSLEKLLNSEFHDRDLEYSFCNISNKIVSVKSYLNGEEIKNILNEFNSIKDIQLNLDYYVTNCIKGDSINHDIIISPPSSSSAICIFDSGITTQGPIIPSFVRHRINSYLPYGTISPQYSHGTFVASRCIFGDNIEYQISQKKLDPYCYVIDVPVFGIDGSGNLIGMNDFDLSKVITEVIESLHTEIKVYNLSLGSPFSLTDNYRSHLANTLDILSKEYDVLFVVSSGNILSSLGQYPDEHFTHPNARIGSPAESLLSLTVGSIAKFDFESSVSKRDHISPFSRIGPGTDGGLKPELVTHGGNLVSPYVLAPFSRIATCGFFDDGISLAYDNGTSFSSPLVSRYSQMLFDYYPFANTNLVKALLIHFSEKREIFEDFDFDYKFTGFGEPNINKTIYADNSATYLYQGNLDLDNYDYVKFNIPHQFVNDQESKLKLKITIVYNPEVDINSPTEYSQTRLSVKLVKNTGRGHREISLSDSNNYFRQWSPILQFEKTFSRNFIDGEWEVALRLYTRGIIDPNYTQSYAIVIEVIDVTGKINVYDEIKNDQTLHYNSYENLANDINYA
ncbi:S8 family peptidase [Chryseobacterium sp. CBSDS_008]|uniref:S8 family peptidase n=1 Tax=Chryseobacterium sp. CBSDS_008 TaxID=3415265 RepID=UPI003CEC54CC